MTRSEANAIIKQLATGKLKEELQYHLDDVTHDDPYDYVDAVRDVSESEIGRSLNRPVFEIELAIGLWVIEPEGTTYWPRDCAKKYKGQRYEARSYDELFYEDEGPEADAN